MDTIRNKKLSSVFYTEIAEILHKEFNNSSSNYLVTLIRVYLSCDMSFIMGYIAIYPFLDKNILKKIRLNSGFYRKLLSKKLRYRVKKIPELDFCLDKSLEIMEKKEKKFFYNF
ncbi:ribosome-binding factor A [Blattabacterium cuenoti]|uniref:ribosome-binding factor A n=1 Tax=Blattabacterium cuenoti TaxID=1653831 RepID=UPI00163BBDB3|nr:ribosome-binding factor A [Blattabacterium cuenoti]